MGIPENWRGQLQRYTLTGSRDPETEEYSIQPPPSEVMTEEERREKRRERIRAENPVDPRIAMEKKLGLPPGSILFMNGILVFASGEPVEEKREEYAA